MTAQLKNLQAICDNATKADVALETLGGGKLSVSVHWPETQGDDGDHCHGQGTILSEARKVLAALESEGWEQCEFGGRKDFGHSGGTTHFAVERASVRLGDLGTGHVWYSGIGAPAGCDLIADDGEPLFLPREDWNDLEGTVEDNKWTWDGKGSPTDERGNTVQKIVAFV